MEIEHSRQPARKPATAQTAEDELQQRAFRDLVTGLQAMSTNLKPLLFDFGWAAGQIAGDPNAPARIRGMMEFAVAYYQFGLETAMDAIANNGGVRVDIMSG